METKRCQTRFVSPSRFVFHLLRANGRHGDACLKVIFFSPSEFPAGNNSFPLNGTRLNFVYAVDGAPLFLSFFLSFILSLSSLLPILWSDSRSTPVTTRHPAFKPANTQLSMSLTHKPSTLSLIMFQTPFPPPTLPPPFSQSSV